MSDGPPIRSVIGLPPVETARAFDARGRAVVTRDWTDMWQEDHARAFTVAKVAKLDLLAEIQASLADVIHNGGTFEQWQANIVPHLKAQGWWGEVNDAALTGTHETVSVGPRRLRTIYDTNLRVSRAAGRWARIQELKASRPFLRYTAVLDRRTRPEHREWHGTILPVDHAWWDTHFPPCGWYCRCTVRQLSQRELDAKGWKVTGPPPAGPDVPFRRVGAAASVLVPAGISPGFAYNPGKAAFGPAADNAVRAVEQAAPINGPAARAIVEELLRSEALDQTLRSPGAVLPVMVIDPRLSAAIGATTQVVRFSADGYAKQQGQTRRSRGHPELTLDDYRQLPALGARPEHVFQDGDNTLVLMRARDGRRTLRASIRRTAAGDEIYLLSLRYARAGELAKLLGKFTDLVAGWFA